MTVSHFTVFFATHLDKPDCAAIQSKMYNTRLATTALKNYLNHRP